MVMRWGRLGRTIGETMSAWKRVVVLMGIYLCSLLVVAVPNLHAPDAKYYGPHWAGFDLPRHLWHFSTPGLTRLLSDAGFCMLAQHPLFFDAFYDI